MHPGKHFFWNFFFQKSVLVRVSRPIVYYLFLLVLHLILPLIYFSQELVFSLSDHFFDEEEGRKNIAEVGGQFQLHRLQKIFRASKQLSNHIQTFDHRKQRSSCDRDKLPYPIVCVILDNKMLCEEPLYHQQSQSVSTSTNKDQLYVNIKRQRDECWSMPSISFTIFTIYLRCVPYQQSTQVQRCIYLYIDDKNQCMMALFRTINSDILTDRLSCQQQKKMGPITSACCDSQGSAAKTNLHQETTPVETQAELTSIKRGLNQGDIHDEETKHKELYSPLKATKNISENSPPTLQADDIEGIERILKAPTKKIKWTDFTISYLIGSGGFGQVFLGELNSNRVQGIIQRYAIKRIKKADVVKKRLTQSIRLQKKILEESSCNFITKLFFAFKDDYYLYIVMEWAEGGDTYSFIKQNSPRVKMFKNINQIGLRFILACLILGLEYLHSKNIVYRDLKPENLLLFSDGYVKLTDFGLARELKENEFTKTLAGTTIYYAPEMVLGHEYNRQVDLWALGVYSYEMSNFAAPFAAADIKNKTKVKKLVQNAETNRIWKNQGLSLELKRFIDSLLKFDHKKRLGAKSWEEVKSHDFFTCVSFDWKALENLKMQSPLKSILSQYKMGYTPYDPSRMDPPVALPSSETIKDLMPSWSVRQSIHYT